MKIYVNEQLAETSNTHTEQVRAEFNKKADVVILNGHLITGNRKLEEGDQLVLIEKGAVPEAGEMASLMAARHTPGVHKAVKRSAVGIAGLGGLGSNIAVALARLGVGKLVLVDFDVVEPSNLNRQNYFIDQVGMKKTEALKESLIHINPYIEIETKDVYLDRYNVLEVFKDVDIIAEAFDKPENKAELVNAVLEGSDKLIVAASGMAGYFSSNIISTKKFSDRLYIVGDHVNEAQIGSGLMSPRVMIAAGHQANMILRLILNETEA